VRPRVEIASTVCGGCHTAKSVPAQVAASHLPHYEDWNSSAHRSVREDLKEDFTSSLGPSTSIQDCGRCHSGTVRDTLLEKTPLPSGHEAGAVGVGCATCHDPHAKRVQTNVLAGVLSFTNALTGFRFTITNNALGARYTNQLREPLASLTDYHAGGNFTTNYNAQINVCAQCHNDRGASSLDGSQPPHHSAQYNMLLGTVGELTSGLSPNLPAAHSRLEKQCITCHMPASEKSSGHKFAVTSYDSCATCHGSAANAQNFVIFIRGIITSLSQDVKEGLDQWAISQAPAELRKYGALAWEYQYAGQLSSPDGSLSGPVAAPNDPTKDEQKYIPAGIKKARFNLYLVINEGSYGVHNGPYALTLLEAAQNWIQTELNK
jgi:formate-dependent nitrite reductase cytochrome c552 subunit